MVWWAPGQIQETTDENHIDEVTDRGGEHKKEISSEGDQSWEKGSTTLGNLGVVCSLPGRKLF